MKVGNWVWWNVRGPASGPALACERVVGLSDMNTVPWEDTVPWEAE